MAKAGGSPNFYYTQGFSHNSYTQQPNQDMLYTRHIILQTQSQSLLQTCAVYFNFQTSDI